MHARQRPHDAGATAVEFAILAPLVFLILFGIIQYGYGLFQLQAFNATMDDASRFASRGVLDCGVLTNRVQTVADANGLTPADVGTTQLEWLDGTATNVLSAPLRSGYVRVTSTYTPFRIGIPLVPFPAEFTMSSDSKIEDLVSSTLVGC